MAICYVYIYIIKLEIWIIDAFIVLFKYICHVYNNFNVILT